MLKKIISFLKKNPKRAILMLVLAAMLLIAFFSYYDTVIKNWPRRRLIEKNIDELSSKQKELQREIDKQEILVKSRGSYISHSANFWIPVRDGDPETNAQKVVEEAAVGAGLKLTTVGRVNPSKLLEGVNSMEISVQASGAVGEINGFIERIYKKNPRFYWSTLSISVDNVRNPLKVILNGSLRFISISDDGLVKKLTRKEEKDTKQTKPAETAQNKDVAPAKAVEPSHGKTEKSSDKKIVPPSENKDIKPPVKNPEPAHNQGGVVRPPAVSPKKTDGKR